MTEIPWWAHTGIGIIVAGFSKLVELRSQQNMTLFFFAGIIFVVFGLGKYAYNTVTKNKSLNEEKHGRHHPIHPAHHQNRQHHSFNQQHQSHKHQNTQQPQSNHFQRNNTMHQNNFQKSTPQEINSIVSCPRCGTRHYSFANFCMSCGMRLK